MRQSEQFLYTLREPPGDAEVVSHRLLAQAGFILKIAAGIYVYAPAMWRTLQKVSQIVREEMNREGAQEVMLPIMQPAEIWQESGRWDRYIADGIMFHLRDRKDANMCLGPTHEEVITRLADRFISSYKQLPVNMYQIQTKFRDEIRPRFGLMRGREFIMKDAYTFDVDDAGLDQSYKKMARAYHASFERCGLKFTIVDADSGAIGSGASQEFVVIAETGEDNFLICDAAGYAANEERASSVLPSGSFDGEDQKEMAKEHTPDAKTIEDLVAFLPGIKADRCLKTLIYRATYADRYQFVAALIRGDCDINEVKLNNHLDALAVELAADDDVQRITGADTGFAGPIGLNDEVIFVADESVRGMVNAVCGACETDYHYVNVNVERDYKLSGFADIRKARAGELCVLTKSADGRELSDEERALYETRGIEVGHIFKLGTKYSTAMNAMFTAEDGTQKPFVMGCYGIGISRIAAAAIEQCHDDKGMIWPMSIAPWQVHLLCLNTKKDEQRVLAEELYDALSNEGIEVLYDDRPVSPGIKFNDADLIGVPLRITVGRDAAERKVEYSERAAAQDKKLVAADDIVETAAAAVRAALS